jgi:hypothetical protein
MHALAEPAVDELSGETRPGPVQRVRVGEVRSKLERLDALASAPNYEFRESTGSAWRGMHDW